MSQLGARLEEKRRAIEAQKKRIEAIFAKHRQRLGKSAFLQLKRGGTWWPRDSGGGDDEPGGTVEEWRRWPWWHRDNGRGGLGLMDVEERR
uniref:Uncharacterized protein n=1 Tax=Accipiter nisus TaxID=211598 RepID=A0A8B9RTY1_9AVES